MTGGCPLAYSLWSLKTALREPQWVDTAFMNELFAPAVPNAQAQVSCIQEKPAAPVSRLAIGLLLVVATITSAWLTVAPWRIESTYLRNYGFFCDPSAYYVHNIHLHDYAKANGAWAAIQQEVQFNARHPLRTVPYLLVAPDLLIRMDGHLWTQTPFLWVFLGLLSTVAYLRTRNLLFSVSTMTVFAALPFLYDPGVGLGAYWLDFTAACCLGSAALCLIAYHQHRHWAWLLGTGAFFSATALARFSSAFYLLSFLSVAVPLTLLNACGRDVRKLARALVTLSVGALPGIVFVLAFYEFNRTYYQTFGFAFGAPLSQSIEWTTQAIVRIVGVPLLTVLLTLIVVNVVCVRNKEQLKLQSMALWLPISLALFVCLVVRAVSGTHPLVYFGPALVIAAMIPVDFRYWNQKMVSVLSAALLICSIFLIPGAYDVSRKLANAAPPTARLSKKCDESLANLIVSSGAKSFLQFNDETVNPHLESFFKTGRSCSAFPIFSRYDAYLKGIYPGQDRAAMIESIYKKTKKHVQLVAVFAKPEDATKPGAFPSQLSAAIAQSVSARIAADPHFKLVGHVMSPTGLLSVYQNTELEPPKTKAPI